MFGIAIDKIGFSDVDAFCRSGVREGVLLDFKRDFPSRLDKTIAAFANTYGGIILIGVDETSTGEAEVPIVGLPLTAGLRERVIQIGLDAIYPPVVPEVRVVEFKSRDELDASDRAVIVVRVHESDTGSHAVNGRTTVYFRVENLSNPFRKATVDELEWFANKREKSLQERDRILQSTGEHARQYLRRLRTRRQMSTSEPKGHCVFWTVPRFPKRVIISREDLLSIARQFPRNLQYHAHSFPFGNVSLVRNGIFFDGNYSSDYKYTEIQQQGLIYHEYGFWWDKRDGAWATLVFPSSIAELLVAGLSYGLKIYERVGYWGTVDFKFSLIDVRERQFTEPNAFRMGIESTSFTADNEITVQATGNVNELFADGLELLKELLTDIAWAFGDQVDPTTVARYFTGMSI